VAKIFIFTSSSRALRLSGNSWTPIIPSRVSFYNFFSAWASPFSFSHCLACWRLPPEASSAALHYCTGEPLSSRSWRSRAPELIAAVVLK
jgi:hypothetical protein